jgi:hypothetical protein
VLVNNLNDDNDDYRLYQRRMLILNSSGAAAASSSTITGVAPSPSLLIPTQASSSTSITGEWNDAALAELKEARAQTRVNPTQMRRLVFLGTNSQMPRPGESVICPSLPHRLSVDMLSSGSAHLVCDN